MSGLTSTGFDRKRLVDILADLEAAEKAVFGENIDLNPESRFGQLNGIIGEAIADAWEDEENLYNSFIPSSSSGNSLSNLVQLNGITRDDGDNSTVVGTITGTAGLSIPAGKKASVVGTEEIFVTLDTIVIPAGGSIDVAMSSEDEGAIEAAAGTLTQIETPIFGWASITNVLDAVPGRLIETNPELRARREISTSAGGNNITDALAAQLLNLDGVTDALVVNNRTDIVDANGLDPHTFAAVLVGGTEADIVAAIWANTPQGIDNFGALTAQITDGQGFLQDIKYNRGSDIDIYFKLTLVTNSDYPSDGDVRVKAAVVEYGEENFRLGDDVVLSQFYTPINTISGITSIIINMNDTGAPVTETANLTILFDEISRYDIADISII